ncbi:MAG: exodeoxyribonuclease VII large subunit [Ignavibacteria bacterium RBG_13_36_8]|nr:MAG: exodeoxyribonuclease VII large subunit [Ignavibacteria bacterium RBG_13_36_8]
MSKILSVSEITTAIKEILEVSFEEISVVGEISNFKAHVSGHWYFTLKDSNAQINCTMWRGLNSYVFFTPQDGMKVIVNGKISVYPPRGSYQIDVRSMKPAGEGELQAAFERLKKKLANEGLFDEQYKKPIPEYPQRIGIVSAIGSAALKDMISVASRRYPLVELVISPSKVQGEGAAEDIVRNLKILNQHKDIDVIIIARGGGSLEDLWAFNEEIVARAIFASLIPVISGVGHEIDFTIADFVADLRAATPSAAMELATPDKDEIFAFITDFSYTSADEMFEKISGNKQNISHLINSYGFRIPQSIIKNKSQFLDNLIYRIQNFIDNKLNLETKRLELLTKSIESNDLNRILMKGYTLVKQGSKFIRRAKQFHPSSAFSIKFYDKEVDIK